MKYFAHVIGASIGLVGLSAAAANLVPGGDFTEAKAGKVDWCRAEGGRFSLFTEEYTWNNCGRFEVREAYTNGSVITRAASVTIGRDGKFNGFAVKPDTTYDFSIDLRGGVKSASVRALSWHGDSYWKDREALKVKPPLSVTLEQTWKTVKGSFHTPSDAKRAALQVSLWSSTEGNGKLLNPGDFVLFDNVKVEESAHNFTAPAVGATVPARKAVASGDVAFDDFVDLRTGNPAKAKTSVRVVAKDGAFCFDVVCDEPSGVSAKDDGSLWTGDSLEIWFGAVGMDRVSTQFGIGANGGKYVAVNGDAMPEDAFDVKVERAEKVWKAHVRVPFASIGWGAAAKPGDCVAFNVGRFRRTAHVYETWSPLKAGFNDTEHFGELVYADYAAALKKRFGIDVVCTSRADYEAKVSAAETVAREAKFARFKGLKFAIAPVPVTSDFAVPFLPEQIFDPPTEIRLTAAVNEQKALPLALANLTGHVEEYVVLLEDGSKRNTGEYGLKDFPAEKLTVRKALRMKDSDGKEPTLRLDPLPTMDGASSISVPAKEAGLVWFDFDTTDVPPGTYTGRLRVIPLGGFGAFTQGRGYDNITYSGDMQVIPVTLEVRPIVLPKRAAIPTGFFMGGLTEEAFDYQVQLGAEYFSLTPWSFFYNKDKDGNLDLTQPGENALKLKETIRKHLAWGATHGFRPRFLICYSAVYAFRSLYNPKKDPEVDARLWPQYVRGVQKLMNACGIADPEYAVETYDEPPSDGYAEILAFHQMAKKAAPTMRLEITLGHRKMKMEEYRRLGEVTDEWIVWDNYFTEKPYRDFFAEQAALGKTIRHYTCDTSPRAPLDPYYRKKAWFGARYGLSGNMMYQFYDTQGGIGARDFKTSTKGGIVYFAYGKMMPSIRFMAFREGITDFKYFARLKELAPGDPTVERFLTEAITRAMGSLKHDPAEPDRLRERAAKMILEKRAR